VTTEEIRDHINAAFQQVLNSKGKLAYLALSSKTENHIRDNIAYSIFTKQVYVSREFGDSNKKRFDIAVLSEGKPKTIVELKWDFLFDWWNTGRNNKGYKNRFNGFWSDIVKWQNSNSARDTELFVLSIIVDATGALPPGMTKYKTRGHDQFSRSCEANSNLRKSILDRLGSDFRSEFKCPVTAIGPFGDTEFDIEVSAYCWLIGPIPLTLQRNFPL
jgi:hypothetical protein